VSVSPKFQVVIPKEIREALQLFAGQRMEVRLNEGKVEFVPEQSILSYKGRWPGIDSTVVRDADRGELGPRHPPGQALACGGQLRLAGLFWRRGQCPFF
jgi:AbrB family looped-hinge helix DNA binding protein